MGRYTLRESTIETARAIRRYANGEILHETMLRIMDEMIRDEPEPEVIAAYQLDRERLHILTTEQLLTLADDYWALADSPPSPPDPKPAPSATRSVMRDDPNRDSYWTFPRARLDDNPSRVTIVGGSWDGAKGTDSGRR